MTADLDDTIEDYSKYIIPLRPPETVMRLERIGSFFQSRLSFMRDLLRTLKTQNWTFAQTDWQIDEQGVGYAVYQAKGKKETYSLIAFSHDLPAELRSDRVIATAWDATFTLFDGVPNKQDIERLRQNVPKQEAGRISSKELCLSRANRSVRLWNYVIACLAEGRQPSEDKLLEVGYLMRTTAVYGSAKFGAADRLKILKSDVMKEPFRVELLNVWLIRAFCFDLVDHMAKVKGKEKAQPMALNLKRKLGIGNSTGLGMAPFLMNHPILLNNWVLARERGLSMVRAQRLSNKGGINHVDDDKINKFKRLVVRALVLAQSQTSSHPIQIDKNTRLIADLKLLIQYIAADTVWQHELPWDHLYVWSEQNLSIEGQEQLVSLLLEPFGGMIDPLAKQMAADEDVSFMIDGSITIADLQKIINQKFSWVFNLKFDDDHYSRNRFWYVSEEKLEPRLGQRFEEIGAEYELPFDIAFGIKQLKDQLDQYHDEAYLAEFLQMHPEYRYVIRRIQIAKLHPYTEVQDNLVSGDICPIDLLRCKLSFFGATSFDPRSDRWVRICMYQNAPFPHELHTFDEDDWSYPVIEDDAMKVHERHA